MEIRYYAVVDEEEGVSYSGGSWSGFESPEALGEAIREDLRESPEARFISGPGINWQKRIKERRHTPRKLTKSEEAEFFIGLCAENNYCI